MQNNAVLNPAKFPHRKVRTCDRWMHLISDDELEELATKHGPDSHQAVTLADLLARRAKDEQVHCFQLGEFLVVCPMPTPEEEVQLQLAYEATKHLKGSKLNNIAKLITALDQRGGI